MTSDEKKIALAYVGFAFFFAIGRPRNTVETYKTRKKIF